MQSESPAVRHTPLIHMILRRNFRQSFKLLYRYGFRYEDLVEEGRYAILRAESQFDPSKYSESAFYGRVVYNWIASRMCTKYIHNKRYRLNATAYSLDVVRHGDAKNRNEKDGNETLIDTLESPDGLDVDRLLDRIVIDAQLERLRKHSEKQYRAVKMRYLDDYDNGMVASALGCSTQNASWLTKKGLQYLRDRAKPSTFDKT